MFNAPAIGDVDGDGLNDVVFGSFDHGICVLDRTCRRLASFDNTDSVFSAPALYDVDGDRAAGVFIGGDASRGPAGQSHDGGYFRSLKYQGGALVQRWIRTSTETFQNAGAVGDVNGDGRLEVVTGSGAYYCRFLARCADSNKVWAFHLDDGSDVPGWPKTAAYSTFLAAPALGDIDGDARTDVVVGSSQYVNRDPTKGQLDAFLGNGQRRTWPSPDVELVTPPVIADVNGGGPAEVVVGVSGQVYVLDGQLNVVQDGLAAGVGGLGHKSAAAVGELGPRRWAVLSAGFDPRQNNDGHIYAYDIPSPGNLPWPQFRKNARRLGADPTDPPIRCDTGYRLVAADGGIFAFGECVVPRLDRGYPAQAAHRRDGVHAERERLRAGPPGTAESSASATPGSSVRRAVLPSTSRSWEWLPPQTGAATGWWPPTGDLRLRESVVPRFNRGHAAQPAHCPSDPVVADERLGRPSSDAGAWDGKSAMR